MLWKLEHFRHHMYRSENFTNKKFTHRKSDLKAFQDQFDLTILLPASVVLFSIFPPPSCICIIRQLA